MSSLLFPAASEEYASELAKRERAYALAYHTYMNACDESPWSSDHVFITPAVERARDAMQEAEGALLRYAKWMGFQQ